MKIETSFMKKIIPVFLILVVTILQSCNSKSDEKTEVQEPPKSEVQRIVDASIDFHGFAPLDNAQLDLVFRNKFYTYKKNNGMYEYTRSQLVDSTKVTVYDIMNNDGLVRLINKDIHELITEVGPLRGDTAVITEERRAAFTRSVNSVVYFFLLPYGLNDPAVNKEFLGETSIKGKDYYEVKVTFGEEGGGEDFDDVFLYWFNKEDYSMDYFAYLYHTDGGGMRFREAINPRRISGMLIQDYINFKPENEDIDIMTIDELYGEGKLIVLSEIINENVRISH
jgi:uncharacterized protein DUF6503